MIQQKENPLDGGQQQYEQIDSSVFSSINRKLLICKLFYFFFYGAFGSLFPLISIYFKQLAMNPLQVGILIGIRPFVEFASAPLWGSFADRIKRGKMVLLFSLVCWIVFTLALNFVQPASPFCLVGNKSHEVLIPSNTGRRNGLLNADEAATMNVETMLAVADIDDFYTRERLRHAQPFGVAPSILDKDYVLNYDPAKQGNLVSPPHSKKVYRKSAVEEVFMLLLVLIIIGEFFSAPAITLVDSCTLNYLGDRPNYYGRQRMFGSIGWALAMFVIGIMLDYSLVFPSHPCGLNVREKNYTLCFASFSILMSCALITATQFQFPEHEENPRQAYSRILDSQNSKVDPAVAEKARAKAPEFRKVQRGPKWLTVMKTFASPHYMAFLFVTWWMGFGIGIVFCFLFWHLQDLGGSPSLYGMASVINHLSEVCAYFFSFRLINKVGHVRVLYIGLLANLARFLYVSWLEDPWWVLPFEFVQGLTHAAVWAAATSYISLAAPPEYKSSAQGLLQGIHHGFGRGCGALLGGVVISYTGTAVMFRAYGFACLVILFIFIIINRYVKTDGIKYQQGIFPDEDQATLAPHGIPMNVPYSPTEEKLADSFSGTGNYGATDPMQEAYDRYVHEPYDKPVRFEQLPDKLSTNYHKF
ncbi:unnamed protein product [Soboliphyme baturini]|uniref:MFS_1_like domain-containing protein n=1 Tax=Soboliphyme baturini TaxID=241478 RepID=A0A183IPS3_9BILA|nr:unnamed protein product [Soboliphyme baturini]